MEVTSVSTPWLFLLVLIMVTSVFGATNEQRIVGIDFGATHITSWYFDQGRPFMVDRLMGSDEYCSFMSQVCPAGGEDDEEAYNINATIVDLAKNYINHMEKTAASQLGRPQKVGAFTYPQWARQRMQVLEPLYLAMSEAADDPFEDRMIRSNTGAALTYPDNNCFFGWTDPGDINYDEADEVLVIESYLDEFWAMYLHVTTSGPLMGDERVGRIVVKADHRELAKAIGELDRMSSKEIAAVIISGDISPQGVKHIRSNVSQELPHLESKFKTPYAGPEHVKAIGAACLALNTEVYAGIKYRTQPLMLFDDDQVGHNEL